MKNKVVVVTGAALGIGLTISELFAKNGYKVYGFSSSRNGRTDFIEIETDVNSDESIKTSIARVLNEQGRIDILVTCVDNTSNPSLAAEVVLESTELFPPKLRFPAGVFNK